MSRAVVRGVVLGVLALGACNRTQEDKAPVIEPRGQGVVGQVRGRLAELEKRYGPDAYGRPEVTEMLKELQALGPDSPEHIQALELMDFLRAKQRLVLQAQQGPIPGRVESPNYGPMVVEGKRPESQADLGRISKLQVGSTREELVAAYGSCLVRQTWFPGRGGPVNEVFQVLPECRDKLTPKVYRVEGSRVAQIYMGTVDTTMTVDENSRREPPEEVTAETSAPTAEQPPTAQQISP